MSVLLEVRDLKKHFPARDGKSMVTAVDGVSLTLAAGTTLGIVGESGCGKSTLARLILRLVAATSGTVIFKGTDLSSLGTGELRSMRRGMQIVFQDPFASLDPRMSVGAIVSEPLDIHGIGSKAERKARVRELLSFVGLDADAADKYPHEFSGGQRQRIGIARAIAPNPQLLILDEPVSALDVSIQSQVLNLLLDIKARLGLSYIFISHDLSVVRHVSDAVAVMYLGRIVERGGADEVFDAPMHPYTQALVSAVPGAGANRRRIVLAGDPPNPEQVPPGCAFHPRCSHAFDRCRADVPGLKASGAREAACHLY
jgi:oligopeptide/dipeptide ABC transporter ATP-binding protein